MINLKNPIKKSMIMSRKHRYFTDVAMLEIPFNLLFA
jgi:hypothetical protein